MKFKCIENREHIGHTSMYDQREKLTIGQIYYGNICTSSENGRSYMSIVVFNDNKRWCRYKPELFEPVEE